MSRKKVLLITPIWTFLSPGESVMTSGKLQHLKKISREFIRRLEHHGYEAVSAYDIADLEGCTSKELAEICKDTEFLGMIRNNLELEAEDSDIVAFFSPLFLTDELTADIRKSAGLKARNIVEVLNMKQDELEKILTSIRESLQKKDVKRKKIMRPTHRVMKGRSI